MEEPASLPKCPVCHHAVRVKDGRFADHQRLAAGRHTGGRPPRCPGSGQEAPAG